MLGAGAVRAYVEGAIGASLSEDEAAWMTERLASLGLAAGAPYVQEGSVCRSVAFVSSGLLRVIAGHDGDDRTTYFAVEGEFASDYGSFLTDAPSRLRIEAVEPTTLLLLSRETVHEAYDRFPWGDRLGRVIAERLFVEAHQRLVSFYLDSAEDRYLALQERQPDLLQRVPQHMIAEYVGVRPPSLSRIRARLACRG
ncbi:MAG: Crp/Fnr family transcriptional regulator [Bacteroidota bacterium]